MFFFEDDPGYPNDSLLVWEPSTAEYDLAFLTVMVSGGLFLAARYAQAEKERRRTMTPGAEDSGSSKLFT